MNPNIIYLAAYSAIVDEKFYEAEWMRIKEIITTQNLDDSVKNEVMKIFGDVESKISLDTVVENLKFLSDAEKEQAISLSLVISLCDGYLCKKEDEFIKNVAVSIGFYKYEAIKVQLQSIVKPDENVTDYTPKRNGAAFYKFLSLVMPETIKGKLEEQYKKCLLSGADYSNVIDAMRIIAQDDINFARESFKTISEKMKSASLQLQDSTDAISASTNKMTSCGEDSGINSLNGFLSELRLKNIQYLNDIRDKASVSLTKKEEALRHYTISFMGRTKAGKSTLHSIILGGNNREFIGVGKERTTRYNRVYQWNGIRIIDTPGIGAPGGKHDEEIASEIIDETDLICYLVTSDSIQKTEFKFLKSIKDHNKPVIILLNVKDNFERTTGKRERFLKDPLAWYNDKGKDDINGLVNRIREYTSKYYKNSNIEICPVLLLAAKLSQEGNDASEKNALYKGSRLQSFLDDIRVSILKYGKLKRSQTILDGTIYYFNKYKNDFSNQIGILMDIECTIQTNSINAIDKIHKAGLKAKRNIKNSVELMFDNFITTDLQKFSIANYNLNNDKLKKRIDRLIRIYDFNTKTNKICEIEVEKYKNEVNDILMTFNENLDFDLDKVEIDIIDLDSVFDTKTLLRILSGIVGLIGFCIPGPIAIATLAASLVLYLSSIFIKTKKDRIKMAQDKLYNDLKEQLEDYKKKTVSKMTTEMGKATDIIENKIQGLFKIVFDEIDNITQILTELKDESDFQYDELNKIYAARIVNFAAQNNVFDLLNEIEYRNLKVYRDFGKYMKIIHPNIWGINTEEITKVLQENLIINENEQ